jgi:hypothetical protein
VEIFPKGIYSAEGLILTMPRISGDKDSGGSAHQKIDQIQPPDMTYIASPWPQNASKTVEQETCQNPFQYYQRYTS